MKPVDYIFKFNKDFYYPIKDNIKISTIRKDSKPVNIGDDVVAYFPELGKGLLLHVDEVYSKRFKDLSFNDAECEGYAHPDLLRHELYNIYPDITADDYVYIYKFTVVIGYNNTIGKKRQKMAKNRYLCCEWL